MRRAAISILLLMILAVPVINPTPAAAAPNQQGGLSACAIAVNAALSKQGAGYVWGAKGPTAFDCSGLTYWAYQQAGMTIGVSSYDQQATGVLITCTLSDLHGSSSTCWQSGDLIFLSYPGGQHVALYAGNGLFMDAYNRDVGVILHDVSSDSFYRDHFWQARRPIECAGTNINPGPPSTIPAGNIPAIEAIADILPPITLLLPWSCGACASGQANLETLTYPDFGVDVLYPFKWFGVWIWNELFRSLICWLLAIAQAMLNALAFAYNAVIVAGFNFFWRISILFMLWFRSSFLSLWGFVGWLQLLLWSGYGAVLRLGDQLSTIGQIVVAIGQLISEIIVQFAELVINLAQILTYFVGLFMSIVPGMISAAFSPTAPEQSQTLQNFFLLQWILDFFRALADSKLGWVWAAFVGITYLRFIMWLLDEIGTLNQ